MEECCVCGEFEWMYVMSDVSGGNRICPHCLDAASTLMNLSNPYASARQNLSSSGGKRFKVIPHQSHHNYNQNRENYLVFIPK